MIKDFFDSNNIDYQTSEVPDELQRLINFEAIKEYLSCLGESISFYPTPNGAYKTNLYGLSTIMDEVYNENNKSCVDNGYLIIGSGPNGDLLCVNCENGLVGYAYHDDLWEGNYDSFSDIYIEMSLSIEQFIDMLINNGEQYPFDGYEAEKYIKE